MEISNDAYLELLFNTKDELLSGEIWTDVFGYDGLFLVSSLGRIRSLPREIEFNGGIRKVKGCIRKSTLVKYGKNQKTPYISLKVDGVRNTFSIMQLVGISFIGVPNKDECFYHINKNAIDNRLENIGLSTITDSMKLDHKKSLRTGHNLRSFEKYTKPKFKIIRDDGKEFFYSDIVKEYGKAVYSNILKGYNCRGHKWDIVNLNKL